jgi:hypothetical protein
MELLKYNHTTSDPSGTLPTMQDPTFITSFLSTLTNLLNTYTTHLHILTTLLTLILPIILLLYIHRDYKSFLSLGPGGTPSTPLGYLKIKLLSILSLRDPLRPIQIPPHFRPQHGYLSYPSSSSSSTSPSSSTTTSTTSSPSSSVLPARPGPRPKIHGIAPQRQITQKSPPAIYTLLSTSLRSLAADPSNALLERTSCFEKHSTGLFTATPLTRVCGGEICHAHPSDGSLHLSLHPADVKILIEKGWGERHPLARGGWCRRFVPKEFVLVYAPRDEEEVGVVMRVVAASVWWVSGRDVEKGKDGGAGEDEGEEGERKGKERKMSEQGAWALEGREQGQCWACRMHGCGDAVRDGMVREA